MELFQYITAAQEDVDIVSACVSALQSSHILRPPRLSLSLSLMEPYKDNCITHRFTLFLLKSAAISSKVLFFVSGTRLYVKIQKIARRTLNGRNT